MAHVERTTASTTIGRILSDHGGSIKTGPFGTALKAAEYSTSGTPLISVREIGYGEFRVDEHTPRVSTAVVGRLPEFLLQTGDIVFARKGAVDRLCRVGTKQNGWFLGSDGIRLRLPPEVDSSFMVYQLRSSEVRSWLLQHATGTIMASLNNDVISRVPVVVPPLPEQRAIAHILGTLDDKIELNRRTNETLEAMARALFKSWFVDFDPVHAKNAGRKPEGMDAETAALFPDDFEDSEMGKIPRGWRALPLGAILAEFGGAVQTGPFGSQLHASDYEFSGVPVVMPKDIVGRTIDVATVARVGMSHVERLARHRLKVGDLLFSRRGDVEKHALVSEREAGWLCGTGCLLMRQGDFPSRTLLSLWMDQPTVRAWLTQHAVGATMPNLNTSILESVPSLLPPTAVARSFEALCKPVLARGGGLRTQSETLSALRDALLPQLLSGSLRVPEAMRLVEKVI